MKKRLYRSTTDVMVGGVLAGLAEYFDHDPTLWRLGFVVVLVLTGVFPFVFIYLLAWIVVPQAPDVVYRDVTNEAKTDEHTN
ncbi:MAG: PspC domain-containing protein [Candidatus Paceibacterota bacterium]